MAKRDKNQGSEYYENGKKKRIAKVSNKEELPYKEFGIQGQSIKSLKLDYDVWTGDPVEVSVAERN